METSLKNPGIFKFQTFFQVFLFLFTLRDNCDNVEFSNMFEIVALEKSSAIYASKELISQLVHIARYFVSRSRDINHATAIESYRKFSRNVDPALVFNDDISVVEICNFTVLKTTLIKFTFKYFYAR